MITALLLACLSLTGATAASGEWTYYLAYHNTTQSIPVGHKVYALYNGNLLSYDTKTGEVQTFTKNNGLNGREIRHMGYSETCKCLVLAYTDCNIDLLYTDGEIINIPQIKNADDGKLSINGLTVSGDNAMLGMSDGVVHLNLARQEIKGYYSIGRNISNAAVVGERIFAASSAGIFIANLKENLSYPASWMPLTSSNASLLTPFDGALYYVVASGNRAGLWRIDVPADGSTPTLNQLNEGAFSYSYADSKTAVFSYAGGASIYTTESPLQPVQTLSMPQDLSYLSRAADGTFWGTEGTAGLTAYTVNANKELQPAGVNIPGFGPRRDLCYYLTYPTPSRLLIGGGRLDPMDGKHYPATVMQYENGRWSYFQEDGISEQTGVVYRDVTRVIQHPADSSLHYVSTGGNGLYEFKSGRYVRQYSIGNSALTSAAGNSPKYVRIDGLNYDHDGNLWMVNNGVDTIIRVLKADGSWKSIGVEQLKMAPTLEKTIFDNRGRFWVASRRSADAANHTAGLLCVDYNGTLENTDDDIYTYRTSAPNQDGTACNFSKGVLDIMQDTDGSIWVGVDGGLYVISDPDTWTDPDFYITQIKVPRNDGTNYADYLLNGVTVNALAVDGAGRKWIGTFGNGLYLVSPDGTEIISHFRASTSPLLSDNIYDIAINAITGEVMIGTDQGLCSYQSGVTAPAQDLNESNVKVFPNPVHPDYRGSVTVTGLTADAEVRITTTGGQAVYSARSLGGSFTWDLHTLSGRRAASGVYYIMVSNADGSSGIAAKVVVI